MTRSLRRITLVLAGLLVVAFSALLVLARVYDGEVKAKLIGTLNGYLRTPVTVSRMDLTLIERFPQASIHLRDVLAMELRHDDLPPDTLLYAGDLYLEFSLLGMLRGDYTVSQVHGEEVTLRPALDAEGRGNWAIWRPDSTGGDGGFALERVTLGDLNVRFRDTRSLVEIRASSERLLLGGRFARTGNNVKVHGTVRLDRWTDADRVVLSERQAEMRLELAFGGADEVFRITRGEVITGEVPLAVTLMVGPGASGNELDLRANGLGLDLAGVVQLLPDPARRTLIQYSPDGQVDLALTYKGNIGDGPELSVGMKVVNGRLKGSRNGAVLKAMNGECAFDLTADGTLSKLLVRHFSAKAASGSISGQWDMRGLKNASLKADLHGDMALADLMDLLRVDTLEEATGRLTADLHVEGRLRDVGDLRPSDLRNLKITGIAGLTGASLKVKGVRHRITDLTTQLALDGTDADVRSLDCTIQGNALHLRGSLRNLMPYLLFDGQVLTIAAEGSSPRIDLAALLRNDDPAPGTGREYALKMPALIQLDLQTKVDELVFEEFTATNVNGTIRLKDRVLRAGPVMFQSASGGVLGELTLDGRTEEAYPLTIQATVKDIDVKELFAEFQEFGQQFITSAHLTGTANAQVNFSAPLYPTLRLDLDRLQCTTDLSITDGAIRQHAPLMEVAAYVKKNKLIAPFVDTEELRTRLADVSFTQLENRIEIRDRMVIVPAMTVHSSAMDVELSGVHGFDDQIDHHINFRLSELLRARDGGPEDEFGPVVDDGTGLRIFLHMYGDAGAPRFETDGAMAAQRRSEQIKVQTAELRSILHNELNPFKKKEGPVVADPQIPAPRFEVEFGTDTASTSQVKKAGRKRGLGGLLGGEEEKEDATFEVIP